MARHANAVPKVQMSSHGIAVTKAWFAAGPAKPASQLWANSALLLGFQATPTVPKVPTTPTSNASPIQTSQKRDGVASRRVARSHALVCFQSLAAMVTQDGRAPRCTAATRLKSERQERPWPCPCWKRLWCQQLQTHNLRLNKINRLWRREPDDARCMCFLTSGFLGAYFRVG